MPQPLPPKEASQFRTLARYYEEKQYKRAIKSADLILKKNPKHGETMAMKALTLNAQGKTEEAFALGKVALTADMKSYVCWHVYGLLYRANKNFEEAIKAFKAALKLQPDSAQIQRDLALMQIQMRDYQGYIQSRAAILQARPQLRQNWTGLAIAHHLAGGLADAEKVLTTYEETLKATPSRYDLEHSEATMYKNTLIAEQEEYERALEHLNGPAKKTLDRLAVLEKRAEYLEKLGRKEEAATAYRALLDRNAERPLYYEKLVEVLNIAPSDASAKKALYDEYAQKSTRRDVARRIPLDFLHGDDFRQAAKSYFDLMFSKGVSSTFANLKHLYSDPEKKEILPELAKQYLEKQTIDTESKDKGEAAALYFLAQHYNYRSSRDLARAEQYVEQALKKDPKSVEYAMTKARIVKHAGNLQKASELMDEARKLDLKDRYINTKAAKYQLRNNECDKALSTVGMFTRPDTPGGPLADLLDMQCVWFLTEAAEAHARQGEIGLALKRLHAVRGIFDTWHEDQFDLHNFSLRRGHIRAYIDLVRWEDHIRDHPFFTRVALSAISVYIVMDDHMSATNGTNGTSADDMEDALAKKKALKKAKKEQQKLERDAEEKRAKQDPNKGTPATATGTSKKDEDPLGLKLAATEDPLGEAMKFLDHLLQATPRNLDAQIAGCRVYLRKKKYLLALRCLNAAAALEPESPQVHEQAIALATALKSATKLPTKVSEVIKAEFKVIDPAADLRKINEEYRTKHKSQPSHLAAALKAGKLIGENLTNHVAELQAALVDGPDADFGDAVAVLESLQRSKIQGVEDIRKAAANKWPEVTRLA